MKRLWLLPLICGCVTASPSPQGSAIFEPLAEKQLPEFERRIAIRVHNEGRSDDVDLAIDWLNFANCIDVEGPSEESAYFAAHEGLRLEALRRDLRIADAIARGTRLRGDTLGDDLVPAGFFSRESDEDLAGKIVWPSTESRNGHEKWSDEIPTLVTVESRCSERIDTIQKSGELEAFRSTFFDEAEAAFGSLSADGAPGVIRFRLGVELVRLMQFELTAAKRRVAKSRREKRPTEAAEEQVELYRERLRTVVVRLEQTDVANLAITAEEKHLAAVLIATKKIEDGSLADAAKALAKMRSSDDVGDYWLTRYLELYALSQLGRQSEIAAVFSNDLPPRSSKFRTAYAYRLGRALRLAGDDGRFLDVVKRAFRDQAYRSSPFLRALYFETLAFLVESPFEREVSELIEELGPRGETYDRLEELARVALDRGRPENARAIASWLLARNANAKTHPRYHAIHALAAFLEDDDRSFRESIARVVHRNPAVVAAVKQSRRPAFFAHADSELARILQQTLPLMAEWGDTDQAKVRRQKWLEIIVEATQDFLRKDKRSLSRPTLVKLYRLASALLKEHPRGYAERVGSTDRTPLVLGTVQVPDRDLRDQEPALTYSIPTPYSLTLVPSSGPVGTWRDRWGVK